MEIATAVVIKAVISNRGTRITDSWKKLSSATAFLFVGFYQVYGIRKDLLWKTASVILTEIEYEGEYPGCYNSVQGTEEK